MYWETDTQSHFPHFPYLKSKLAYKAVSSVSKMLIILYLLVSFSACLVTTVQAYGDEDIRMTNQTVTNETDTFHTARGLQICVNKKWATVCQRGWDDVNTRVACRQLGLEYAVSK